ncbi:sensor histidine kinase [Paenibacillus sp. IB182496]|uniref:histidine kinase n=1 Tax=Paenibacillus sabuli TaxID=2772509 RepID=A0A927GQB8_9BACL|nr:sensor histidine kinase [Paenibacillus sabuli]MBD2844111.1 sensor histidine kinase [Paenibacillus sabuli]
MKPFYMQISLKRRIWVALLTVTVIGVAVTGSYAYYYASGVMERSALQTSQDRLNKTAQVVDERLRHIIVATSTLMIGEPFQRLMAQVQSGAASGYFNLLSELQTPFTQMKLNELTIDSAYIVTPIGEFYPTDKARRLGAAFDETTVYEAVQAANAAGEPWTTLWVPGHAEELFTRTQQVVTLVMTPIYDTPVPDVYIVVNIKQDTIDELIRQNLDDRRINQVLLTRGGELVLEPLPGMPAADPAALQAQIADAERGDFEYGSAEGDYLVNFAALDMNPQWVLLGYQSKAELLAPLRNLRWAMLSITGVCLLLALLLASLLSELLLRPLLKLRNLMQRAGQHQLDVRFESRYEDEVTQVGYKFNAMLEQIQSLIVEVKRSEQEKRKSEVKALQAQIDPHFLYNTLNTIFWKSEMEEHETAKEMIVSLSLLFRLGLNNGREHTTLGQELEHVEQYLILQARCYPRLFDYEIRLEAPELRQLPVLKLLLQPLVENAIEHGLRELEHKGRLVVDVRRAGERLLLEVTDNGSGMNVEEVRRRMERPGESSQSYALSNVRSRLLLEYGDEAEVRLASVPGEATRVTLVIPIDPKGGEAHGQA